MTMKTTVLDEPGHIPIMTRLQTSNTIRSCVLLLVLASPIPTWARQAPPTDAPISRPAESLLDGVPEPFIPARPRTDAERKLQELRNLFAAARSYEDRKQLNEAVDLLREAERLDPEEPTVLQRLCRLSFALGRVDEALAYGIRALEADPTDSTTLSLLVALQIERRNDRDAARKLLTDVLANPRLPQNASARLVALRLLGDFYYDIDNQPDRAADAYDQLVSSLDERTAVRMTEREGQRVLRGGEAESYLRFGEALVRAGRYSRANLALRRGLLYEPNHAQIPRVLAESLFRSGQNDEALRILEAYLKRQPQGQEAYALLGEILKASGRADEFTTRIETAAQADPKNLSLQFLLADRYREAGREAEAEALLRKLLETQGDVQVYGPLVATLTREQRVPELINVLGQALGRPGGLEVVAPQLQAIGKNPELSKKMLDQGLAWLQENPPKLEDESRRMLSFLANQTNQSETLLEMDRLMIERDPSPQHYREYFTDLFRYQNYAEAAQAIDELMKRYPGERSAILLGAVARSRHLQGDNEAALQAAREAEQLDPDDRETAYLIGFLLGRLNRTDEAIAHYSRLLKLHPDDEELELRARAGLSSIYSNLGDYPKAEAELEILLEKYPDDAGVNNDLGYLYAEQGKNLDRSEMMTRKALDQDPENASYLDSLGWVLYQRGKINEALEPLEKAAKDPNATATIHDHLGDAYFRLKRYAEADQSWSRAEAIAGRGTPPDKLLEPVRKKREELKSLQAAEPDGRPRDP